jgi:hypothetical protein
MSQDRGPLEAAIDRAIVHRAGSRLAVPDVDRQELWDEILRCCNDVTAVRGLKVVAADLDTSPSTLKHCMAERDRHYLRAEWLIYFVQYDHGHRILRLLARIHALDVAPQHVLTPEEKVERLEARLRRLGPDGERWIGEAYE